MSASTKLSTAVKALSYLASVSPMPKNSADISDVTGINASKLRKLLSLLVKSNIVESEKGTNGGFKLKKKSKQISLQEIYCAIEDRKAFHLDVNKSKGSGLNKNQKLNNYFLDLFNDIQINIENEMEKISLKNIIDKINSK
ncbi:MAG: Rrf2 family transcriptional regulator [Ignavibacterium sp.]|nr:Rrf2 family transcriptional regulator [Ignavibacterium sp.]